MSQPPNATPLRLEAFTASERHAATDAVRDAFSRVGAWILDFEQFGNLAICLRFEVAAGNAAALGTELAAALHLTPESTASLGAAAAQSPPEVALPGTLNVRFLHDEPDLQIPKPRVPG